MLNVNRGKEFKVKCEGATVDPLATYRMKQRGADLTAEPVCRNLNKFALPFLSVMLPVDGTQDRGRGQG